MACKTRPSDQQAVDCYIPFGAFKLLEVFSSSGLSTRWKLSSWNGITSLLVVWGSRKHVKKNQSRPILSRKRSCRGKKTLTLRKRNSRERLRDLGLNSGKSSANNRNGSTTSYSQFSSDDMVCFGIGSRGTGKMNEAISWT